jgi:DNA-binding winged helix-turn-helix (wHTH) protein
VKTLTLSGEGAAMAEGVRWTPTQRRILAVLADWRPHSREELHACLNDDLGSLANLWAHVSNIRKALQPLGRDIVSVRCGGVACYRLVSLAKPAEAEAE